MSILASSACALGLGEGGIGLTGMVVVEVGLLRRKFSCGASDWEAYRGQKGRRGRHGRVF